MPKDRQKGASCRLWPIFRLKMPRSALHPARTLQQIWQCYAGVSGSDMNAITELRKPEEFCFISLFYFFPFLSFLLFRFLLLLLCLSFFSLQLSFLIFCISEYYLRSFWFALIFFYLLHSFSSVLLFGFLKFG